MCMCVRVLVCVCTTYVQGPSEARRGRQTPGTRLTGGCELPNVGAGIRTWVLCKSNENSLTVEPSLQPLVDRF